MNDFLNLSREYLEAGEALYQLGSRNRPVAFCYIQSMELLLKGLLQQQSVLTDALRKTHDLEMLWNALDESSDELKSLIEELSPIDPKTTKFRYPRSDAESWDLDFIRNRVLTLQKKKAPFFQGQDSG